MTAWIGSREQGLAFGKAAVWALRAAANNKWVRPALGSAGGRPASPATGGSL